MARSSPSVALPYALVLGEHIGATRLELVSVYNDEPVAGGWALSGARVRDSFDEYQRQLVERVRSRCALRIVPLVLAGSTPKRLEQYIERQQPALVVMSTHGRGPVSRAWLGSVADHTIRHVRSPVLLVRPREHDEVNLAARPAFRRVLVPLDGSALAESALPMATTVARAAGAALKLVRVVGPHYAVSPYLPHTIAETREATERDREEAEAYPHGPPRHRHAWTPTTRPSPEGLAAGPRARIFRASWSRFAHEPIIEVAPCR